MGGGLPFWWEAAVRANMTRRGLPNPLRLLHSPAAAQTDDLSIGGAVPVATDLGPAIVANTYDADFGGEE